MRKRYSQTHLFGLVFLLSGAISCHQDLTLPTSAIPQTCQVHRVESVNESVRDTTFYAYTAFGHLEKTTYRQWTRNVLTASTSQTFTYDDNHFLVAQVDQTIISAPGGGRTQSNKTYSYIYSDGQIQQIRTTDASSGQVIVSREYSYSDGKLKTYTEREGQNKTAWVYEFAQTGKLTQVTGPSIMSAVVTNGKITKKTFQDGTTITYEFDGQGQLTKEITTAGSNQTERTYTYDTAPYWNKTQLLLRGIPSLDLGSHTFINNIKRATTKQTQDGRVVQNQVFDYQRVYTKAGYTLGYGRSDGARQNIVYANCL